MGGFLDEYRRHAADHGKFTSEGDADLTNAAYDNLEAAFLALVRAGQRRELFRLYDDTELWVQAWAATHTLEIDEARALGKLVELENSGIPHVSTDARYTIQEWKNGNLRFPCS
jgi:hypothetical protein